jgi:uncharacterized protein YnzC (UPF0291/DUF896 family)
MITKEDIDRINFLARKSKAEGLTEDEKVEQQNLRRKYIDYIKSQVRAQLDSIEYVEDRDNCGCSCGCDHKHGHGHHHHHHHKHHKNN